MSDGDLLDQRWPPLGVNRDWLLLPKTRRLATVDDPLLFAWLYLPHHLRSEETGGEITLSPVHEEWADRAREWMDGLGGPQEHRDAYVAPRGMGKSTWHFLILPMWAAAHGHVKFIAAFADSATQAETHLQTFRHELDSNTLLRTDFPDLCRPAVRGRRSTGSGFGEPDRGTLISDNRGMMMAASGFVFAARGIDSGNLGMKVGNRRPELLILDDVEPGEAGYSGDQVKKRLGTIRDVIFPLNVNARVSIVGTVTMPGSIVHQLVRSVRGEEPEDWITEENIAVHYHAPFVTHDDGTEESVWPGRWSTEFLNSIRHTRAFAKNYANDPRGYEGGYWTDEDFTYGTVPGITRRLVEIDPAVTTKKTSDPTGIAILAYRPEIRDRRGQLVQDSKVVVEHVEEIRLTGAMLRRHVLKLVERWNAEGRPIGLVRVESNQGGDLWNDVFHDFPVRVRQVKETVKKEIRAAEALSWYQRKKVLHERRFSSAEEQMIAFPNAPHDDMVDAIGAGVLRFLAPKTKTVQTAQVDTA